MAEGKGGRKRGRETSMCGCLSRTSHQGTWPTTQVCVCPDWESNRRPCSSQTGTQSTEPHQAGQLTAFFNITYLLNGSLWT